MSLKDLLNADAILPSLKINSKKQALQELSEKAALVSGIPSREIFDALLQLQQRGGRDSGDEHGAVFEDDVGAGLRVGLGHLISSIDGPSEEGLKSGQFLGDGRLEG